MVLTLINFYFSPYHVDSLLPDYKKDSKYRKPNVGMLQQIQNEWALSKKYDYDWR